jgi:hypothetical protein
MLFKNEYSPPFSALNQSTIFHLQIHLTSECPELFLRRILSVEQTEYLDITNPKWPLLMKVLRLSQKAAEIAEVITDYSRDLNYAM